MSLINVITRFSREKGFRRCLESLNSQTYKGVHHYITYETKENLKFLKSFKYKYPTTFVKVPNYNKVKDLYLYYEHHDVHTDYLNWDWKKWGVQVVLGGKEPPRQEIKCKEDKFEVPGYWCMSLSHTIRKRSAHAPYNFYLKIAEQHINEGWIGYLDDDDVYTSETSLEDLASCIEKCDEDTLHFFRMIRETGDGENLVPSSKFWNYYLAGHPIIHGEAGGSMICFHSKYKEYTQWGEWTGDDYRSLKALEQVIPKKNFINQVLYNALKPGVGK